MGNPKNIEQLIREKMQRLQMPYEPEHWELMLKRLRKEPGFGLQENDKMALFAERLRLELAERLRLEPAWRRKADRPAERLRLELAERLKKNTLSDREQHWEAFEQRLYDEGILSPQTEPETLLRNSLRHREEPYNPTHWQKMSKRIDEEFSITHRLIRYKVVEVAVMLLLIVSVLHSLPFGKSLHWLKLPGLYKHEQISASAKYETARETQPPLRENNPISQKTNTEKPNEVANPPVFLAERRKPGQLKQISSSRVEPATTRQNSILPQNIHPQNTEGHKKSFLNRNRERKAKQKRFNLLTPLFQKERKTIATKKERKLKAKSHKPIFSRGRASLWAAYDYNRIYSPRDPVFNTSSYLVDSFGTSTGIDFGIGIDHWEFRFGAAYASVAYRSFTPQLKYGNLDLLIVEEFKGVRYDLLELPTSFSLYLHPSNRHWDAYVSTGVSGVFVLNNSYDRHYTVLASAQKPQPSPDEIDALLSQSKLQKKNFSEGILEGGRFKDNSFLFGQISLGLEKRINARWQCYFEPTYRVHLSNRGLGPNRDHLRNLSLRLGLKAAVW